MFGVPNRIPGVLIKVLSQCDLLLHQGAIGLVLAIGNVGEISEFHLGGLHLIGFQKNWHTPISLTACRLQLGPTLTEQLSIVTTPTHQLSSLLLGAG